jgi:hypothetical protein
MRPFVGIDQIAGKLLPPLKRLAQRIDRIRRRGERMLLRWCEAEVKRHFAPFMGYSLAEIYSPGIDTRRRACLQPPQDEAQIA